VLRARQGGGCLAQQKLSSHAPTSITCVAVETPSCLACFPLYHAALSVMADVYVPDFDALRMGGMEVAGERRAVRLMLTGDYQCTTAWCGHVVVSSKMPCQRCTAMRRVTKTNGEQVAIYGDIQAGSHAGGKFGTI